MGYECHITVPQSHSVAAQDLVDASEAKAALTTIGLWKTSAIAGDPLLGDDTFFYLTSHSDDYSYIYRQMETTVKALRNMGVPVLREKIEQIVHDVRYNNA